MDLREIERTIESEIPDAEASVSRARGPEDDDHLEAVVESPAFADLSIVEQHDMVYDALGDRMTTDIHALELTTRTPEE